MVNWQDRGAPQTIYHPVAVVAQALDHALIGRLLRERDARCADDLRPFRDLLPDELVELLRRVADGLISPAATDEREAWPRSSRAT